MQITTKSPKKEAQERRRRRKADIMINTLLGFLIALAIFGVTIWGLSQLFRLSGQAEESFHDFAEVVKDYGSRSKAGDSPKSMILHLDKGTFIAAFARDAVPNGKLVVGTSTAGWRSNPLFSYPQQCAGEQCLCLCQSVELDAEESGAGSDLAEVRCGELRCEQLPDIELANSWVTVREELPAEYPEHPRRVLVHIAQENGKVALSGGTQPVVPIAVSDAAVDGAGWRSIK